MSADEQRKSARLWEISNPSDPYTMRCDDFLVAAAAVLILGHGQYGLSPCDGEGEKMPIFLFGGADEWVREKYGEDLSAWIDARSEPIAQALDSVMSFGVGERKAYDLALDLIPEEKRAEYRAKVHEENRSSLNDIGRRAWDLAKALRERAPKDS